MALVHHHDAVGQRHGFHLVVRHVKGRSTHPAVQTRDFQPHFHPQRGVEVG